MNCWAAAITAMAMGATGALAAPGADATYFGPGSPVAASNPLQYESVYAPPAPPTREEGYNAGAVHTDIQVSYFTDYVYRGLERFDSVLGHEDALNLQFLGKMSFDLGKGPHPFIGIFTNVAESDPISNFQEIRPFFGADWTVRPLTLTVGLNTYVFPNRDALQTAEIFGKLQLDDSYFTLRDKPLLSPYIMGAYDYDKNNGWYVEAGLEHDFIFPDTGLILTASAAVAYVQGFGLFAKDKGDDSGFQHYQVGLEAKYSLNTLLNVPKRYGEWTIHGYLYYTDGIRNHLRGDTQLYGGGGIGLSY
jgi:hypothetical protein